MISYKIIGTSTIQSRCHGCAGSEYLRFCFARLHERMQGRVEWHLERPVG